MSAILSRAELQQNMKESTVKIGKAGFAKSRSGLSGDKVHVLLENTRNGKTTALCGVAANSGTATVTTELDTDHVSCTKCLSYIAR